ncbi:MAG: U32 family peptidase, partial [Clostridia bacterium]|nr:U32 family peptidase [Clostridia bacterium]
MELLAPAGNAAALRAAVQSGADAVYIGGKSFGARQSADNFTNEEIKKWADYCHLYGVDLHVTVNTLVKEKELAPLQQYIKALNAANVDALIVQDIGAAEIIKNTCPDLTLHASTQMSVTTLDEVNELQKLGF